MMMNSSMHCLMQAACCASSCGVGASFSNRPIFDWLQNVMSLLHAASAATLGFLQSVLLARCPALGGGAVVAGTLGAAGIEAAAFFVFASADRSLLLLLRLLIRALVCFCTCNAAVLPG
jgi:hypothetical protein